MNGFSPNSSAINITNGMIENISRDRGNTLVTITYSDCVNCRRPEQTVRLVVGNNTLILDENGNTIPARVLSPGMIVDASFSSAMTRSIPPQAAAFMIRIVPAPMADNITTGRIINIDRDNRSFTTIRDGNVSSVIRFNVPRNALIVGRNGRILNFSMLLPGMLVRVRHASFMTPSIPPQTTAFEIRVL